MRYAFVAAILVAAATACVAPALGQATSPNPTGPNPTGPNPTGAAAPEGNAAAPPQSANAPGATAPQASPNDIDGETMFATSCGWCHQQGGRSAGRGPKLAGDKKSDDFLINRIKNGKPGAMPAFGHAFSDGQIIAILAYIRSLDDSGG